MDPSRRRLAISSVLADDAREQGTEALRARKVGHRVKIDLSLNQAWAADDSEH